MAISKPEVEHPSSQTAALTDCSSPSYLHNLKRFIRAGYGLHSCGKLSPPAKSVHDPGSESGLPEARILYVAPPLSLMLQPIVDTRFYDATRDVVEGGRSRSGVDPRQFLRDSVEAHLRELYLRWRQEDRKYRATAIGLVIPTVWDRFTLAHFRSDYYARPRSSEPFVFQPADPEFFKVGRGYTWIVLEPVQEVIRREGLAAAEGVSADSPETYYPRMDRELFPELDLSPLTWAAETLPCNQAD